jgi:hypothetical protein
MNTTLKLETLNSLVTCYYSTTAPATSVLNGNATTRVANAAGAVKRAARVYNSILTTRGTAIGKAFSLLNLTGVAIRRLGLPIKLGGIYLPVNRIADAYGIYDDAIAKLDDIRQDIINVYPAMMEQVVRELGDFASEVRVPTATEVAAKFTMSLTILNQPVAVSEMSSVVDEVANRVRADSQRQAAEMLKFAHTGPIKDLRDQLGEFIHAMRNAERLHLSQFDKLRDEVRRVKELNVLDLPEIEEVAQLAAQAAATPVEDMTGSVRNRLAKQAETAAAKADETLASLGLA